MARLTAGKVLVGTLALAAIAAAGVVLIAQDRLTAAFAASEAEPAPAATAPAMQAQPVRATTVAPVPLHPVTTYTGTVRPRFEGPVAFRLDGKVAERLVDAGDAVTAGQVLARLDDTDARLDLESAEAEVRAAAVDLDRAGAEERRSRELLDRGFVAQAALDRATSTATEARSRLDRAERSRDRARNQVAYTVLQADADAVVTARRVEAGQVVEAGQPVVILARTDAVEAEISLPEQRRATLDGARLTARLWDEDAQSWPLTLREVSPDVDPVSRTYRVRLAFDAPDARVALGRTVTVDLWAAAAAAEVVPLPLAAVIGDGRGPAVWRIVAEGTRVERVPVTIVAVEGDVVRLRGALAPGDLVVGLGAAKIDPARPVRVVETVPAP